VLKKAFNRFLENGNGSRGAIRYTDEGNRSVARIDDRLFLRDPHMLRLLTEYRATGNFTGHLKELTEKEAGVVSELREGLRCLEQEQLRRGFGAGQMWAGFNEKMLHNALTADPRLFNHAGALNYKTFAPQTLALEAAAQELVRILALYDHLRGRVSSFEGLFTEMNSRHVTLEGHRLSAGIRCIEEREILRPTWEQIRKKKNSPLVLEIGAGGAQLTNLLLREQAKMVVIDLPGMHARGPYLLYKSSGARICTYARYLQLDRRLDRALEEHDVVYLPPWERESVRLRFDLAVNVHSLGEMPVEESVEYLRLIGSQCDYFFSINTSARDLDRAAQADYSETSILDLEEHLKMRLIETGTPLFDSILQKTIHYGYAVYQAKGIEER